MKNINTLRLQASERKENARKNVKLCAPTSEVKKGITTEQCKTNCLYVCESGSDVVQNYYNKKLFVCE